MPGGIIIDISGPAGSGKSSALYRTAATVSLNHKRVVYIDATGSFRPERILSMGASLESLDCIEVFRAFSVAEQMAASDHTDSETAVLLLDGITELFIYEYAGPERAFERGRLLAAHMRHLSCMAQHHKIPILITNTVRYDGTALFESMERVVEMYSHIRVQLGDKSTDESQCSTPWQSVSYKAGQTPI